MSIYLVDIVLIIIFVLAVIDGWRRGFIKMLLSFLAFLVSLFVASQCMVPVGAVFYDSFVRGTAVSTIEKYIDKNIDGLQQSDAPVSYDYSEIESELPDYVIEAAKSLDISLEDVLDKVEFKELNSHAIAETLVDDVLHGLLVKASESLAFVIVLVCCEAALSILIFIIDKIARLPVLKQVNKTLGLALGALTGIAKVFIIAVVIGIAAQIASETAFSRAVDNSKIVEAVVSTQFVSSIIAK